VGALEVASRITILVAVRVVVVDVEIDEHIDDMHA